MLDNDIIVSSLSFNNNAQDLFDEYLRWLNKGNKNNTALIRRSYRFIDELVLALNVPQSSPCKRKCNACCKHGVELSQIEAMTISNNYNVSVKNIKAGFVEFDDPENAFEGELCPFNLDGDCQVYNHRPIVCRVFHSQEISVDPCYVIGGGGLQFNYRSSPIFMMIMKNLWEYDKHKGGGDIRNFFGYKQIQVKK